MALILRREPLAEPDPVVDNVAIRVPTVTATPGQLRGRSCRALPSQFRATGGGASLGAVVRSCFNGSPEAFDIRTSYAGETGPAGPTGPALAFDTGPG